jgi:RhtB (resistance to homoserine/threonine) family protein
LQQYLTFLFLSIVLVMSPGVDTALVTKTTLSSGRKSGSLMVFGLCTGVLVHTFAATVGLSAILMKSAVAFSIVKYAGAVYLLYLGVSAIWSTRRKKGRQEDPAQAQADLAAATAGATNRVSAFRQGLLSNVLNPKVAIFFLTFLPQFVVPEVSAARQLFVMGGSYAVLTIVWYLVYVHFINYLRKWIQSENVQNWMERVTGAVLIGFGLKLAFEKR